MEIRPIPELPMIDEDTDTLYHLEDERSTAIRKAAKELGRVLGHKESEFWVKTMPEELATLLESYERATGIAAALGYLRQYANIKCEFSDGTTLEVPCTKRYGHNSPHNNG